MTSQRRLQEKFIPRNHDMWHHIKYVRRNLVTSSPLLKYQIHQREIYEPHGFKHFYTGSYNSYTERSHDEENIENRKLMDELSNKDREDMGDSESKEDNFQNSNGK